MQNHSACLRSPSAILIGFISFYGLLLQTFLGQEISEIMYRPSNGSLTEASEFLELHNPSDVPLDLSGYSFDQGIQYTFPSQTILPAQGFMVLAQNLDTFHLRYPEVPTLGPFTGRLSNEGESLRLRNRDGATVWRFSYQSDGLWPAAANGAGHSLVPTYSESDLNRPEAWKASQWIHGSPGAADTPRENGPEILSLVAQGSTGIYFKGTGEPSQGSLAWTQPDFTPSNAWLSGPSGYGYSNQANEQAYLQTVLDDMRNNYLSVYVRLEFTIQPQVLPLLEALEAEVAYDDGFVLYLNGTRVAGVGVQGNPPPFDRTADNAADYPPANLDLTPFLSLLRPGRNVLAVQGHNGHLSNSSDFVLRPTLSAVLREPEIEQDPLRALVINELQTQGASEGFEILNPLGEAIDLTGLLISDDPEVLDAMSLPSGTSIPAGGVLWIDLSTAPFQLDSAGDQIFLTHPERSFVAAAYAFGLMPESGTVARFPDGSNDWYFYPEPSPGQINPLPTRFSPIVIQEIMYHSPHGSAGDFIEIHNTGLEEVLLGNWSFRGIDYTFANEVVASPGGYLVLGDSPEEAASLYQTNPVDWHGDYGGALANGGERLRLLNEFDVVMDSVRYDDSSPWPLLADGFGASLERACLTEAFDQPQDWRPSPLDGATPGQPNSHQTCDPLPSPKVLITEVMYHPPTEMTDPTLTEYVELYNLTDSPVSLADWSLVGDIEFQFPPSAQIAPGQWILVAKDPDYLRDFYSLNPEIVFGPYQAVLPNGGGTLLLADRDGNLIDSLEYDDDFPWPSLADGYGDGEGLGYSLERQTLSPDLSGPGAWTASLKDQPSPGEGFSRGNEPIPPRVTEFQVTPFPPQADRPVTLQVEISQVSTADKVEVEYWVDDLESESEPRMRLDLVPVESDLNPQSSNILKFEGTFSGFPPDSLVRCLVRVQDTLISPVPTRDAFSSHSFFVAPTLSSLYPVYHLRITPQDWNQLLNNTAAGRVAGGVPNPTWDNEVPAVFIADGVVHEVSVRHQGSRWNRNGGSTIAFPCPSPTGNGQAQVRSWRIDFPSYRNHNDRDVIILQKAAGWPQHISFKMFEAAGVPAPKTSWANLQINGCSYNPDAFEIERPGEEMLERWFPAIGDLFKSQGFTGDEGPWSWGDSRLIQGTFSGFSQQERYEYTYNRKTRNWSNRIGDRVSDLVEPMIIGLHQARERGTQALRTYLDQNFDVEQTLRYIATINYVGTFDDMFQNHFLYRRAEDQKWIMTPWDMDNTLGGAFGEWNAHPFRGVDESRYGNVGNRSGWWNRIKDSFFIAYEQEFLQIFHYLNNSIYGPSQMDPIIEQAGDLYGASASQKSALKNHIQQRHDYLNNFIQITPTPILLNWEWQDNEVVFSWPFQGFDYRVEASESVNGNRWKPLSSPVLLNHLQHQQRWSPSPQTTFFRLVQAPRPIPE